MQIGSPEIAEIFGAHFDWVAVDLEHGVFSVHQLTNIFRAIELGNSIGFARLNGKDPTEIRRVLESGAVGLIIPNIADPMELKEVVRHAAWPPKGQRGVGFSRVNLYGRAFNDYKAGLAQDVLIVPIIESKEGVANIRDICLMPEVDAIFIGPYDLSASLGVIGRFDSAEYRAAIARVVSVCKEAGVALGIHVVEPNKQELSRVLDQHFQFIAYSLDAAMLNHSCEAIVELGSGND